MFTSKKRVKPIAPSMKRYIAWMPNNVDEGYSKIDAEFKDLVHKTIAFHTAALESVVAYQLIFGGPTEEAYLAFLKSLFPYIQLQRVLPWWEYSIWKS